MRGSNTQFHWIGARKGWLEAGLDPISALVSLGADELKTHAHVIGATGCGKTNLIHHLIAQDIERRHSLVIFDQLGDLVNAATELAVSKVSPSIVKVIDLRERVRPFGFNPLAGPGEPYFRALASLDAVSQESESWGVQLAETLRNSLMLLGRCKAPLTAIERLFSDPRYRAECLMVAASDHGLQAFWSEFNEMSPQEQRKWTRPVMNKVSLLLATDTLRRILSHPSPINLGEHLNTPGSILLISLAVDQLHGAGRMMGNMILASIHREIFARVDIPEAQRNPVRLYVDEFESFDMELFESIMVQGRRFKCPLVLAHQTLAQLPPRMRSVILGNVGVRLTFRVGREDSHSISRDLFDDLRAYDFTKLRTGNAVLWRRDKKEIELEVNEPLFRSAGSLSAEGRAYLRTVYEHAGESVVESSPIPPRREASKRDKPIRSDLEDWLR